MARRAMHAALAACACLTLAGCSVSFPILGLSAKDDVATTSSVLPARTTGGAGSLAPLVRELGPEDMRRADAALAVALDPQGNGAAVSWDNPQSGIKGQFTPVGMPFVSADEICRSFLASVSLQASVSRLQGTACRPSGGEWAAKEVKPWQGTG